MFSGTLYKPFSELETDLPKVLCILGGDTPVWLLLKCTSLCRCLECSWGGCHTATFLPSCRPLPLFPDSESSLATQAQACRPLSPLVQLYSALYPSSPPTSCVFPTDCPPPPLGRAHRRTSCLIHSRIFQHLGRCLVHSRCPVNTVE